MARRRPVAELYRAHSWSLATDTGKPTERQPHMFYRAEDIDALFDQQQALIAMLQRDHARMRPAGCRLAAAAMHVVAEYDGLHRLSLAVVDWAQAVADEGDRPHDL
jgi:hypothetical protein